LYRKFATLAWAVNGGMTWHYRYLIYISLSSPYRY